MGVYTDIMKPKWCSECPMWSDTRGCHIGADDYENCPLIEIEEWNSYGHGKMYAPKGTFQKILDDERRADDPD